VVGIYHLILGCIYVSMYNCRKISINKLVRACYIVNVGALRSPFSLSLVSSSKRLLNSSAGKAVAIKMGFLHL